MTTNDSGLPDMDEVITFNRHQLHTIYVQILKRHNAAKEAGNVYTPEELAKMTIEGQAALLAGEFMDARNVCMADDAEIHERLIGGNHRLFGD